MKKLILGRSEDCDVYLSDTKGLISRKHAIMKITSLGQYEITDVSKNGTFINGIRMNPHIPYKVKRKDVIVFANTSKLDWDDIPDYYKWIKIGLVGMMVLIAVIIVCMVFLFDSNRQSGSEAIRKAMPPILYPVEETEERSIESSINSTDKSIEQSVISPKVTEETVESSKTRKKVDSKHKNNKDQNTSAKEENMTEENISVECTKNENAKSPGGD